VTSWRQAQGHPDGREPFPRGLTQFQLIPLLHPSVIGRPGADRFPNLFIQRRLNHRKRIRRTIVLEAVRHVFLVCGDSRLLIGDRALPAELDHRKSITPSWDATLFHHYISHHRPRTARKGLAGPRSEIVATGAASVLQSRAPAELGSCLFRKADKCRGRTVPAKPTHHGKNRALPRTRVADA
jgi:hypothetical protein